MSILVVADPVEFGAMELTQTQRGYVATRHYLVSGVTGQPAAATYSALNHPDIPYYGQAHGYVPFIFVTERECKQLSGEQGKYLVTVTWGLPNADDIPEVPDDTAAPTITVGTTLQEVPTERDRNGNQITVRHQFRYENQPLPKVPGTDKVDRPVQLNDIYRGGRVVNTANHYNATTGVGWSGVTVEQVGEVMDQRPLTTLQVTRWQDYSPGNESRAYVGKLNSNNVLSDGKRSWLCSEITGTAYGGPLYQASYTFIYVGGLGDPTIVFIDPETQRPVNDPTWGEGIKRVEILDDFDFRVLGLGIASGW